MIDIGWGIAIGEDELVETFLRASGAGGQNVNKVETAVQLRFDLRRSPSLPQPVKVRAARLAGRRLNKDGILVVNAQRFRTQDRNRADARMRLLALLGEAAAPPPPKRRPTRPTRGSVERRLASKHVRSVAKSRRGRPEAD